MKRKKPKKGSKSPSPTHGGRSAESPLLENRSPVDEISMHLQGDKDVFV